MSVLYEASIYLFPILIGIYFLINVYLKWNFSYWRKRKVQGPTPILWQGTFPKSVAGKCNLVEELDEIYYRYKSNENYIGIFTGRAPKLFILDPELAKQILTTNFKYFHDNESSKWSIPYLDKLRVNSPFVSVGESWKEKRAELTPVLTASRIRAFHANLNESAKKLGLYIERHLAEPLDAKELINRYTADFMASFIWGIQTHTDAFADDGSFTDVHEMGKRMIEQSLCCVRYYGRTADFPWLRKVFPVRFFPKISDDFFQQLADYALKMRTKMTNNTNANANANVDDHSGTQPQLQPQTQADVINHLLQLRDKKSLSEVQIAGHTTTIMIDGFETAAIVSAHLLALLARNPRVQQKLRDELETIDEPYTYDTLNNLEYLDQCLNETLRIFPPLTTIFKLCTENFTLRNKDGSQLELTPDTGVYISSYSFQRDADYYEQPEMFWPERFDADKGGVRKYQEMGVFLPFGDGPRICLGMKLGIAEVKMAVASIVRKFHVKTSGKTRLDNKIAANSFLLSLDGTIELTFEPKPTGDCIQRPWGVFFFGLLSPTHVYLVK